MEASRSGDVHVVNDLSRVQCGELEPQALGMAGLHAGSASTLEEPAKAFVTDRLDHGRSLPKRCVVRNTQPNE